MARHRAEGGPVQTYYSRHGLNPKTFRTWRKRLGVDVADAPDEETVGGSKNVFSPFSGTRPVPFHVELLTNARQRRSWPPEQKEQIVLDLVRSGLFVERFARQHGLKPSVVHRWRQEMIAESRRLHSLSPDAPAFAAIIVATMPAPEPTPAAASSSMHDGHTANRVEIVLLNGRRLGVDAGIAPGSLRRLVQALETSA
jgi:transposase